MVPLVGIGPTTSPLPRECSTTEPQGRKLFASHRRGRPTLERETGIEPASLAWKAKVLPLNYSRLKRQGWRLAGACPRPQPEPPILIARLSAAPYGVVSAGGEGWIRTSVLVRGQIYSLLPLTTRPPLRQRTMDYATVFGPRASGWPGCFQCAHYAPAAASAGRNTIVCAAKARICGPYPTCHRVARAQAHARSIYRKIDTQPHNHLRKKLFKR